MELVPVGFGKITPDELMKCDEIFLTKTTTGAIPIVKPGPITEKLKRHFAELEKIPY